MSGLRWNVGDATVTRVVEREAQLAAGSFIPGATLEVLERNRAYLHPWSVDDEGRMGLSIHALCVEVDGLKIVVDTCVGPHPLPGIFGAMRDDGSFLTALAAAGFARESVDVVICTHLHFDHVGWNTMTVDGELVPTFPNARYLIARTEHEHWSAASEEAKEHATAFTLHNTVDPLFGFGVVDLVETDHRVSPSVALFPTPGHSPGHVSVRIDSVDAAAIITGDCVHHPVQLAEPACASGVDDDPVQSTATREALVAATLDTGILVIGTHFPPPTAGHMVTPPDGPRFRPVG
jgi:glyoxylase-like metal-dependent hydrolase (beta-lactamase superfamily II)